MIHIVGAGLTGATLARLYAEAGERATVYEKAKEVGGLCRDFEMGGTFIPCFGPHFFHTNDREVFSFIGMYGNWERYENRVLSEYEGSHYLMPISPLTLSKAEETGIVSKSDRPTKRYAELIDIFYGGYSVKQWGVSINYLSDSLWKRVAIRQFEDGRYFTDKYQFIPIEGYSNVIANMLNHENIKLKTNHKIDKPKEGWIWTGRIDKAVDTEPLDWRCLKFKAVTKTLPAKVVNYPGPEPYTREHQVTSDMVIREYPGWSGKKCYPMPTEANRLRAEELKAEAKRKGIILAGRMGTYSYLNMDQAIRKAMDIFKELTA